MQQLSDFGKGENQALLNFLAGGKTLVTSQDASNDGQSEKGFVRSLFDSNGRFIALPNMSAMISDFAWQHSLTQPLIDYAEVLEQGKSHWSVGEWRNNLVSAAEFEERSLALQAKLQGDELTQNACAGLWLPLALPHIPDIQDIGFVLNQFIAGVELAYRAAFKSRAFVNYLEDNLAGNLTIVSGTRHSQLLAAMQRGSVVGLWLLPFSGYSILACIETFANNKLSAIIPDYLFLAGGFDTAAAYLYYPKILALDIDSPIITCPALAWRSLGLLFFIDEVSANFIFTSQLANVSPRYLAGVFCLG
jgi:hypothetical protein